MVVEVSMRTRSEELRDHADECRKLAAIFHGAGKSQYEELARQWLKLAEHLDCQHAAPERIAT
jgi:predicted YcjX-like family ATPase